MSTREVTTMASDRFTCAVCPKCNHLNPIEVGADARMHELYRYRCVACSEESVVAVVMRGVWPSPMFSHSTTGVAVTPVGARNPEERSEIAESVRTPRPPGR